MKTVNLDKPKLYQCPYEAACKCSMLEPCNGCETWAEAKCKPDIISVIGLQEYENVLFKNICSAKGLTAKALIRQALRCYQIIDKREDVDRLLSDAELPFNLGLYFNK